MKIIFSHPTGNSNVRAAASGFVDANLLFEFHTAIASFPGDILDAFASIGPLGEIRRRAFDPILKPRTKMRPWLEIGRLTALKSGIPGLTNHEKGFFCIDAVYRDLDNHVASRLKSVSKCGVKGVYAYEDGAAFSFREAKRLGLHCLYDLPTGYWRSARRLLANEHERWPDWVSTITGFDDSEIKLARKNEELRLADRIFVASKFTATTLEEYPGKLPPIEVIPYGFPPVTGSRNYPGNKRLKLLFVGKLSQQKGLADLFAALRTVERHVELTIVGSKVVDDCPALDTELRNYQWIPSLPHERILQLMREHDVLVFPSLFDGFGLVITEAMSQGTPVITTDRTGGPDFIEHNHNGWLFKAGDIQGLQIIIKELLSNPQMIATAGREAMETARRRPWKVYRQQLSEAVESHLKPVTIS